MRGGEIDPPHTLIGDSLAEILRSEAVRLPSKRALKKVCISNYGQYNEFQVFKHNKHKHMNWFRGISRDNQACADVYLNEVDVP